MPIIPAFKRLRSEDLNSEVSLNYRARPRSRLSVCLSHTHKHTQTEKDRAEKDLNCTHSLALRKIISYYKNKYLSSSFVNHK
jgi:hypothetical protein